MAVVPLQKPATEKSLSDITKAAPLHPYLIPSALSITSVTGGMFPSQSSDHVTSMVLSPSSISALLTSVQNKVKYSDNQDPQSSSETENEVGVDRESEQMEALAEDERENTLVQVTEASLELDEPSSPEPQAETYSQRFVFYSR